jgi:hypothetical protein
MPTSGGAVIRPTYVVISSTANYNKNAVRVAAQHTEVVGGKKRPQEKRLETSCGKKRHKGTVPREIFWSQFFSWIYSTCIWCQSGGLKRFRFFRIRLIRRNFH